MMLQRFRQLSRLYITATPITWQRKYCAAQKPKNIENQQLDEPELEEQQQRKEQKQQQQNEQQQQHAQGDKKEQENQNKKQQRAYPTFLPSIKSPFESITEKTKNTYLTMVEIFIERDKQRRNHVEFIYAALKNMKVFGVETDLEVYKALINVMPKGKFIPTNLFQSEFMHYPKQQQCIIDLLEQMEDYGVIPDAEMENMLLNIFGRKGHPLRKYWRMMYWMPKFKNLSPWPLPDAMPNDVLELAKLAVERMCSVDLRSKVTVYETNTLKDAIDQTWIVSGMSLEQVKLLQKHPRNEALYIEGPFLIWLRNRSINYFTLRSEPNKEYLQSLSDAYNAQNDDDVTHIHVPPVYGSPATAAYQVGSVRSVHEQDDGTIIAICATGTSTKDSLLSWIRLLEEDGNVALAEIPVLFRFKSNVGEKSEQIAEGTILSPTTNNEDR